MYLKDSKRKKDGKTHRYWSVVEGRRSGKHPAINVSPETFIVPTLPRRTEPEKEPQLILKKLKLQLPPQPKPKISTDHKLIV